MEGDDRTFMLLIDPKATNWIGDVAYTCYLSSADKGWIKIQLSQHYEGAGTEEHFVLILYPGSVDRDQPGCDFGQFELYVEADSPCMAHRFSYPYEV